MRSEEDLVRVLRRASDQAEPAARPLTELVAARRRRRRTRRRTLLTAAAAVLIAGGTAVAVSDRDDRTASVQDLEPVRKVWPEGISTLPIRAPDGMARRPVLSLGPDEVLLATDRVWSGPRRLDVLHRTTGAIRTLGTVPPEEARSYAANDTQIAWNATNNTVWLIPRKGGKARRLATSVDAERLALSATHLYWSRAEGGISRIPLTGGRSERVAAGLHLRTWPWAVRYAPGVRRNQDLLVNLATGERRAVRAPKDARALTCGPEHCVGVQGGRAFVQRPDGGGHRTLRADLLFRHTEQTIAGRYVEIVANGAQPTVYSLRTGQTAGVAGAVVTLDDLVYWYEGGTITVWNPAAVQDG
jgi:hypothetical protein